MFESRSDCENQRNAVANPSTENNPEACGKKCNETANCNSFAFCNQAENIFNCYLKDKSLNGDVEINNPSRCTSYKKIGK